MRFSFLNQGFQSVYLGFLLFFVVYLSVSWEFFLLFSEFSIFLWFIMVSYSVLQPVYRRFSSGFFGFQTVSCCFRMIFFNFPSFFYGFPWFIQVSYGFFTFYWVFPAVSPGFTLFSWVYLLDADEFIQFHLVSVGF